MPANAPNILFIMTDDQRKDAASIYGNRILKTPNIDRIGAEGIRVDEFFVSQGTAGSLNQTLHLGFRASNAFSCAFWGNDLDTTATTTDLNWHHYACTYDAGAGSRKAYKDGALVGSDTPSGDGCRIAARSSPPWPASSRSWRSSAPCPARCAAVGATRRSSRWQRSRCLRRSRYSARRRRCS